MQRRDFLSIGSLGLMGLGLPSILDGAKPEQKKHEKAVILIWLAGGISHQDSFIVSPDFTEKARPVNGYVDTKSGFKLGGDFKKLAGLSHLFSPAYSFGHVNPSHGAATHYIMTGYNENTEDQQKYPATGSIVSRVLGGTSDIGVPYYTSLGKIHADAASFLGSAYNPFSMNEEGKRNLALNIEKTRFNQRMYLMESMDKKFKGPRTTADIDGYKRQGREMLLGGVREIFEAKNEPEKVRQFYGEDRFAQNCMMARRLIENGVRFVTVEHGGWDMHQNIAEGYANRAPTLDHGLACLLTDLSQRDLLKSTLVVVASEFSRTLLNKDNGRDHWPAITNLVLAGGNYGGSVLGSIDKDGMQPKDNPYKPLDLLKTILVHMDIQPNVQFTDTAGRPRYMVDGEAKVIS